MPKGAPRAGVPAAHPEAYVTHVLTADHQPGELVIESNVYSTFQARILSSDAFRWTVELSGRRVTEYMSLGQN